MERRRAYRVAAADSAVWILLAFLAGSHGGAAAAGVVGLILGLTVLAHRTGRFFTTLAYISAASFFGIPTFLILMGAGI
jgi:hypothetical protein